MSETSEDLAAVEVPPQWSDRAERPIVRHGDVLATTYRELGMAFAAITRLEAFEAKVVEAAKSPSAWLALRAELSGGGQ